MMDCRLTHFLNLVSFLKKKKTYPQNANVLGRKSLGLETELKPAERGIRRFGDMFTNFCDNIVPIVEAAKTVDLSKDMDDRRPSVS